MSTAPASGPPVVGVTACRKLLSPHPYHTVGEKYVAAVAVASGAIPVVLPALGERMRAGTLLERLDGIVFTGSPSNVEPHHYDAPVIDPGIAHDPHRDATTLGLVRDAIAREVPLLAICRGFQELNVALGGTLHQKLEAVAGIGRHRENTADPLEVQYGPAHELALTPGGAFEAIAGAPVIEVNSLHGQAIDRLAPGLVVEGRAPDGLIEAVAVADAPAFALGVQWHPEWRVMENPFSRALFAAFGDACRARAAARTALGSDTGSDTGGPTGDDTGPTAGSIDERDSEVV